MAERVEKGSAESLVPSHFDNDNVSSNSDDSLIQPVRLTTSGRRIISSSGSDFAPYKAIYMSAHIKSARGISRMYSIKRLALKGYLIENDVCYLVLCERNYSKRVAYSYLEDIAQEFHAQYGKHVNTVARPYSFIEFDTYIQKAKKVFSDGRSRRNMNALNNQLQDVQRIMVQNIDDVLQRGTVLSELDTKTQNLNMLSQKYKKDATHLNSKSMYVKAVAGLIAFLVFLLYFFVF